jgi:hypothetical protein
MFARALARRTFATKPSTDLIAKPLTERLSEQNAAFWKPKSSDPVEGLGLVGLLGGTMVVCFIPAIWTALTPASDH